MCGGGLASLQHMERNDKGCNVIAVIGDYHHQDENHININRSLEHCLRGKSMDYFWCSTSDVSVEKIQNCYGIWVASGSPYLDAQNVIEVLRYAREHNKRLLATCAGYQYMLIEYMRNMLDIREADTAEVSPENGYNVIQKLPCSMMNMFDDVYATGCLSKYASLVKRSVSEEFFACNYGFDEKHRDYFTQADMCVVAVSINGDIRAIEHRYCDFYIGTMYLPQNSIARGTVHPLINGFLA